MRSPTGSPRCSPKACPGRHRRSDPLGRCRPRSGRAAARRGRLGDGLRRRAREGRCAADDPAFYVTVDRELGAVDGTGHGAVAGARRRRRSCRVSTRPSSTRSPSRPRAWDVFLAALNLDVPSLPCRSSPAPQPPDGVNFSAVANPEYDAARRRGEHARPVRRPASVWNAAEAALYAQMNILPVRRHHRRRSFGNGAEFELGRLGIIATSLRLVGGLAHHHRSDRESGADGSRPVTVPRHQRRHGVGEPTSLAGVPDPPRWRGCVASLFLLITVVVRDDPRDPGRPRADRPRWDHRPARARRGAAPRPRTRPAARRSSTSTTCRDIVDR